MKKALLIFAALMLMTAMVMAQDDMTDSKAGFGLQGGINLSDLGGDDAEGTGMNMGFQFGGLMTYMLSPNLALNPEVFYVIKGAKDDASDDKLKLNYLEVPVLIRFNIETAGTVDPYLFAGPFVGFLMSAKIEDDDVKDAFKSIDFGATIGAGVGFAAGTGKVFVDGRYDLGLSNIAEDVEFDGETFEADLKTTSIMFNVGYMFR